MNPYAQIKQQSKVIAEKRKIITKMSKQIHSLQSQLSRKKTKQP